MNRGNVAFRSIYVCGYICLAVAVWRASTQLAPEWFGNAIRQGSMLVVASTGVLWAILEALRHYIPHPTTKAGSVSVALAAVLVPVAYLTSAAFSNPAQAEFDTWHLVALFAIVVQLEAIVVALVAVGLLAALFAASRFVQNRLPNRPLNAIAPKDGAPH